MLPLIPGLRYQRNAQNLGFVGSCNAGAALARGEFLVFLNNDTTLTEGWLEALLRTFDSHPDTGLVGAQLVYPDGRLQEAGGIVFADGSGWNYGRFEDPKHPAYTFVREVDYCSGAAIALRSALFQQLGGFDARYAPAYYEDTDLAMKVRDAGLKVRVQPASVVVHHEGVTAGTDTTSGVKAYQVRNQQRFVERWRDTLARRHPAPSQAAHYAAQHRARARVLVIDATTPMPDRDSGSVRLFELLRLLMGEGCAVTFFAENGLDDGRYTQALRDLGVEAWTQPWLGALPDWLAKHGPRFQLIVVSRHYVLSPMLALLRRHAPQARIVFDTVDLHHLREAREAEERGDDALRRTAARTRADELALIAAVDRTWVVSPVEKALLAEAVPSATVDVVSNIHRVRGRGPAMAARHGLLFVGGFRHPPNVDAALWLADAILPTIRATRPDVTLSLVGSDAPAAVLALGERDGITVHGHVPDLEPLIDAHRFSVAPLRYGAGVKGKVNQALAHGLPVIATSCAVEGMALKHGVDALVADDADAFACVVIEAYDDDALWQRLVDGGLANTEREFSPERARSTLRAIFNELR
jgi:GT2 family glycosyltransferase